MAHAVPLYGSPSNSQGPGRTARSDRDAGEVAADHSSDLYVEQEHESRRERFERQVRKGATTTQ